MASRPKLNPCAIGIKAHLGWATLIALAGSPEAPTVILRKRLELANPRFPGSDQPYHFVRGMSLSEASEIIARCWKFSLELAVESIADAHKQLQSSGFDSLAAGILMGRFHEELELERTLQSHALLQAAESLLFRQVCLMGAGACGMRIVKITENYVDDTLARAARLTGSELAFRLTEMGRGLGPPWTADQKTAAAAAWIALRKSGAA